MNRRSFNGLFCSLKSHSDTPVNKTHIRNKNTHTLTHTVLFLVDSKLFFSMFSSSKITVKKEKVLYNTMRSLHLTHRSVLRDLWGLMGRRNRRGQRNLRGLWDLKGAD